MARLDHILSAHQPQSPALLATVVSLRGSGYRRPGARLLIRPDHSSVGAISGGCLERDVARQAWQWVARGTRAVCFDTRGSALAPQGPYGTGCDGVLTLLLRALPEAPDQLDLMAALRAQQAGDHDAVIAHIYEASGALADAVGTIAMWDHAGTVRHDSAFPSALYARLSDEARATQRDARSRSLEIRLSEDDRAMVLLEHVPAPARLLIVGGGEDVCALAEVARPLGWRLHVAWTDPARLRDPRLSHVTTHLIHSADGLADLPLNASTRVVLMTHNLTFDAQALPLLLKSAARSVGLLGPRSRTARLMTMLHAHAALPSLAQLARLSAPVGLDLGGEDPWEVAVSIVAQLVAQTHGRSGGALSDAPDAPIHAPHAHHLLAEVG